MATATSNLRGAAVMIAATGLFVINDSFMKVAMADLPPFEVLFLRGVAAAICCTGLLVGLGQWRFVPKALHPRVLARGLLETAGVLCYIVALANMPIADVVAISQTAPLMLIVAAAILLREPLGALRIALVAAGFIGALMVAQPSAAGVSFYAVLAFATALGIAARDLVGRTIPASVPGFVATFATVLIVMTAAAAMMLLQEEWVAPSMRHLITLLAAGLFVTLGHFAILLAYRFGAAAAVSPFFYSFAIWAVIAGFVIWREVPNFLALCGILAIVASGLAIVLIDQCKHGPEPMGELDL